MKFQVFTLLVVICFNGCTGRQDARQGRPEDIQALNALRQTDPKSAIARLEQHLISRPDDDEAWSILGYAKKDLSEDEQAQVAFEKALEINPRQLDALNGMGILFRRNGNDEKALRYYEQAVAINPQYADAYSSMAVIALKKGDDAKALEFAKKGYDLDKSGAVKAANLAVAYHYNGMLELRDKMTTEAKRLGYKKIDDLQRIYSGEMTLRD